MKQTKKNQTELIHSKLSDFISVIAELRNPKTGCPWMLKQNHESIAPYAIEEAYETAAAIRSKATPLIVDELGDLLLQVVLQAQIGQDEGSFDLSDVAAAAAEKMRRRHPHVFATKESEIKLTIPQIEEQWLKLKNQEQAEKERKPSGFFAAVENIYPASKKSQRIGRLSRQIGFDWLDPDQVFEQLRSEWLELTEAWTNRQADPQRTDEVVDEMGDMMFTLCQLARHINKDSELIAEQANNKFLRRFEEIERICQDRGLTLSELDQKTLENLWIEAKSSINQNLTQNT